MGPRTNPEIPNMLITPGLTLPAPALRQHIAVLGKTGSGKTFAAKSLVEKLLARPQQVAVIDPTGAWWGLRSSRDGKGPGFGVLVVGGDHGDIPLPPGSGTAVAHLVAEQRVSVVIDTSRLTIGERTRWFIDFAGELYRSVRHPLTLVIDEVHNFVPQGRVPDPDTGKMLHAGNQLFSGGRSRGIRLVGISQRPAKWHKDSLTCVDTLIAMRMLAPQDREAVEDWIEGCGDRKLGRQVLDSLAQLATGEGWVWYPEAGLLQRVKFPDITTFDSSKTPEDGGPIPAPKSRAEIDLSGIEAAMAAAIEEAKASDPKALRAEVSDLKRKLADALRAPAAESPDLDLVAQANERLCDTEAALEVARANYQELAGMLRNELDGIEYRVKNIRDRLGVIDNRREFAEPECTEALAPERGPVKPCASRQSGRKTGTSPARARNRGHTPGLRHAATAPAPRGNRPPTAAGIIGPHQRILDSIAWWNSVGVHSPTAAQVAVVASYSPGTGTLNTYFGAMVTAGLIVRHAGLIELTDAGRRAASRPERHATLRELHARIMGILDGPGQRLIQAVIDRGGRATGADEIGRAAGYSPGTGTLNTYFGSLARLGLITRERGQVRATAVLLPEALR